MRRCVSVLLLDLGLAVALGCCLPFMVTAALAEGGCDCSGADAGYGDGRDGDYEVPAGGHFTLPANMNYRNFTVGLGAVVYTQGNVLRVCGTLANYGTITDSLSGGAGGNGGAGGLGADPKLHHIPPHCPDGGTSCSTGKPGKKGQPGLVDGAGPGGAGGGGGGGGGGAEHTLPGSNTDADGGDGGGGGEGGKGGGYVEIHAFYFDNHGEIHADGEAGSWGGDAPNSYHTCGAEYFAWPDSADPDHDLAGGGGGGGGGGCGGNGGTVRIYYGYIWEEGDVRAAGGAKGEGGGGGLGGCQQVGDGLKKGVVLGDWQYGCNGGDGCGDVAGSCGDGGEGGRGEYRRSFWSESGQDGYAGAKGATGVVRQIRDLCGVADVAHYELHLSVEPDSDWVSGYNIMELECRSDSLTTFSFRLDGKRFPSPFVLMSFDRVNGPWWPVGWEWMPDGITALVHLDTVVTYSQEFYIVVQYSGHPQLKPGPLGGWVGMFFSDHVGVPLVFTIVEPWYAYLWWPVKDDGDNWNCDKATADLYFTVPSDLYAVSQGQHLETIDNGPTKTYHWQTNYETAAYLFSVATTNYDSVNLASDITDVKFYIFPEKPHVNDWMRVTDMLDLYSQSDRYGMYPFADEKYGIYQWADSINGGMEHQTASGQQGAWRRGRESAPFFSRSEWHTCHELAHQWWGDLVTCATWHDIWLSEGFACYSEVVWFETQFARTWPPFLKFDKPLDVADWYTSTAHTGGIELDKRVYVYNAADHDSIMYYKVQYKKSPWVLHMLRHVTDPDYSDGNTATFFELLRAYRSRFAPGCARTSDFVAVAESICALRGVYDHLSTYIGHPGGGSYSDLEWFFGDSARSDGWVYGAGAPLYRYWWVPSPGHGGPGVRLHINQVQTRWHPNDEECFIMPIDIEIRSLHGPERKTIWNDQKEQEYWIPADDWLVRITLDPDGWILKRGILKGLLSGVTDLGLTAITDEPGARLNSENTVVSGLDSNGTGHAGLWLPMPYCGLGPGPHDLGTLGGDSARACAVNKEGQIVGDSENAIHTTRPFLWLPEAAYGLSEGIHDLGGPGGEAHARGINGLGQIVGYSGDNALLWQYDHEGGSWDVVDLGTLGGSPTRAWAISNTGVIAGTADPDGSPHAVVWEYDLEGGSWTLTDLGSGYAYCVSDAGHVGGQSQTGPCVWSKEAVADSSRWVPSPPVGGTRSEGVVYGINMWGDAVGQIGDSAVAWMDGQEIGLNGQFGGLHNCVTLKAAWDINDAGTMVAQGVVDGSSDPHVFLVDLNGLFDCQPNDTLDVCDILSGGWEDLDHDGVPDSCDSCVAGVRTTIPEEGLAASPSFSQPFPNPVSRQTDICFSLDRARHVILTVYDVRGRRVAGLADARLEGGKHRIPWTGRDDGGHEVSPGIYIIRMEAEGFTASRKLVLLK